MIRPALESDAASLVDIYNHYVLNTTISFEEAAISAEQMATRIERILAGDLPWLVAEDSEGGVIGYAYASPWKERSAYRFSVEVSVYLHPEASGRGMGTALYTALFDQLRQRGIHAAMGGIALPNPASIALHEKMGMTRAALYKDVGFKFGRWIDVGYWQVILEGSA